MAGKFPKNILVSSVSVLTLVLTASTAMAAGFASRQQSSAGQGFSFAGAGTSTFGLGSAFWNPANITNFEGRRSEYNFTIVDANTSITSDRLTNANGTLNFFGPPANVGRLDSGNLNQTTFTTASYNSYQVNNFLWVGLQTGAPFGSRTKPDAGFSGSVYGSSSTVRAVAATPTIGIKLTDWLSFGAGVTIQQLNVSVKSGDPRFAALGAAGAGLASIVDIRGDSYGVGFTAGVTLKPFQGTEIALGFRSSINHKLEGEFIIGRPLAALNPAVSERLIKASVNLPEIATFGISQQLNDKWTLTGTVQWTNWSRLNVVPVTSRVTGAPLTGLGFRYRDEYFFAGGAQYALNDQWKLRGGVAYERSPITDETRGVRIADNDRIWLSGGVGYKFNEKLDFDLSYSHLFLKNGRVDIVGPGNGLNPAGNPAFNGAVQFNGRSRGQVDIISAALKYRFDDPAPAPVAAAPLIKKF